MRVLPWIVVAALSGCATLETGTQRVRIVTEPPGAAVAALEDDDRKELGPAPVEYRRAYQAYRCGTAPWLTPLLTTVLGGGGGFGIAWVSTARNDRFDSAVANGTLFAAVGLALGIAVLAECRMKDGEVLDHKEIRVTVEASKEGYGTASEQLRVPSPTERLELKLPPLAAPAAEAR